ncbi:hypothetical protein V6R94_04685 [Pediococcus acidilactici]
MASSKDMMKGIISKTIKNGASQVIFMYQLISFLINNGYQNFTFLFTSLSPTKKQVT